MTSIEAAAAINRDLLEAGMNSPPIGAHERGMSHGPDLDA
jgi:hypothetical protein